MALVSVLFSSSGVVMIGNIRSIQVIWFRSGIKLSLSIDAGEFGLVGPMAQVSQPPRRLWLSDALTGLPMCGVDATSDPNEVKFHRLCPRVSHFL